MAHIFYAFSLPKASTKIRKSPNPMVPSLSRSYCAVGQTQTGMVLGETFLHEQDREDEVEQ